MAPATAEAKALRAGKRRSPRPPRRAQPRPRRRAGRSPEDLHEEKQSLQCFRVVATAILDALLAGRADRPEFGELVAMVKEAADVIDRGDLFTAFSESRKRLRDSDALTDALARP